MKELIEKLKQIRKRAYMKNSYSSKFAFVGIGNHSINNLYPIINYLRLELKYIVTKSEKSANIIDENFLNIEGTSDLDKVLNDTEIGGVFISANPEAHFNLVKRALLAGKNVFVEKPPCLTIEELLELIKIEKTVTGSCLVGFQKQYAPANVKLKEYTQKKCSYNYRYVTGSYPEGDAIFDLFIHPLSLVLYLFGDAQLQFVSKNKSKSGETNFLNLLHQNGTNGIIELSTDYSWTIATETMIINSEKGIYELISNEILTFVPKQGTILSMPKEKIFGDKMTLLTLAKRNNFNPIFENNQLYRNGYYSEIENFVKICDHKKHANNSSLENCLSVFELLEKLK
jgi:virulence factor